MAVAFGNRRKLYLSSKTKEASYGTPATTDALFRVSGEPFNLTSELVSDLDLISGAEEPTKQDELARSVTGQITIPRAHAHEIATLCGAYGLGSNAVAASGTGYKHTFTPLAAKAMPTFTAEDLIIAGTLRYRYPGCMVTGFELSMQRKAFWNLSADIIGSGTRTSISDPTGSELEPLCPAFKGGDTKVFIGSAYSGSHAQGSSSMSGSTTITTKVMSMRWRFNNNNPDADLYELGGGLVRTRGERDDRTQELSFVVELEDATHLDYLTAQTVRALHFETTSLISAGDTTNYGFGIIFPLVKYKATPISGGTKKMLVNIEATIMDEVTNSYGTVRLVVFNTQAAYNQ